MKSGGQWLAIVSLDLLGFSSYDIKLATQQVESVPPDRILVGCTHTHSAPDPFGMWGPTPTMSGRDDAYIAWVRQQIAACVEQAARSLQPAILFLASAQAPGLSKNTREKESLDAEVAVLQARSAEGQPPRPGRVIATLVNFACHPEIMNNNFVSADFCGYMCSRIEQKAGGVAVFMNGALGGMVTADVPDGGKEGGEHWAQAQQVGEKLADIALASIEKAQPVSAAAIKFARKSFMAPLENQLWKMLIRAGVLPSALVSNGSIQTELAAASLGPAQIATIPGESYPRIGFAMKRKMTGQPRFLLGLTLDELGYILLPKDFDAAPGKLYAYESSQSVGRQIWPKMEAAFDELIQEVKPAMTKPTSPKEWFDSLPRIFRADQAGGFKATIEFDMTGSDGGAWTVSIGEGKIAVEQKKTEQPDCTVLISDKDFMGVLAGALDPFSAYQMGRLSIRGDMNVAMRFRELLSAAAE
jgi:putative sterol carrier protein